MEHLADGRSLAFTVCRSLDENSRDNEVTIWSLVDLQTTNVESHSIMTFKPPLKIILTLSSSCDGEWLLLAGKDHQMRDVLVVYNFQELLVQKKTDLVARQLLDFDMYSARFH